MAEQTPRANSRTFEDRSSRNLSEQTCYCGTPISADGPTDLYCTPECQTRWLQKGHDYLPIPARPEWRMGASESDWRRSMAWPDVPALPPQCVEQWIDDTDPSPVADPFESKPLPPVPESCYPPGAVDLPVEYARPSHIDRIRNATRRNT